MRKTPLDRLKAKLREIAYLSSLSNLAAWDQEVYMPPKGADFRALSMAHIAGIIHEKIVSLDSDGLLSSLYRSVRSKKIKGDDAVVVEETWRTFEREKKLPEEFVRELSETCSRAYQVWVEARKKSDFKLFLPHLEKIVALKKREAEYVGYSGSPYNALLDAFEPGMTAEEVAKILGGLRDFLVPFLRRIKASKVRIDKKAIRGKFALPEQEAFNRLVMEKIGFDFGAGRLDRAAHPFASGLNPCDLRLTTRYREDDVYYSLGSTIHETGHGLYEQGLPAEHFGTPLAEAVSLGIHESQSRMWENMIGKSLSFWKHLYPEMRKAFPAPFKKIRLEDFYKIINKVEPSFIRTEADELSYNLHVILRFEIEKDMMEGKIAAKDLPEIWNAKMKEYLGVEVPNDALGVLQDVHWSHGGIGYFPTYTLGNLYAAQFYGAMKRSIPDIDERISRGDFSGILAWLRKNIHSQGKRRRAGDLVKKVTGKGLESSHFERYLEEKYAKIYRL